jgi:hypothetical protein
MKNKKLPGSFFFNVMLTILFLVSNFVIAADEVSSSKEAVRIGTWNIEHFMKMFDQDRMPERSRNTVELYADEEDQYEVAVTIRSESFEPDILVIQECCDQEMLEHFCKKWFPGKYAFIKVFDSNVAGQNIGVLAKQGFEPLRTEHFVNDRDPMTDTSIRSAKEGADLWEKNLLFSRGPGFVLFQTPKGNKLWVGSTHSKSKSGNNKAVTQWRIREYERTRQICGELIQKSGVKKLVILGDFNDDFGMDSYETSLGQDAIETMISCHSGDEELICMDKAIWGDDPDAASYHCQIKPKKYRSFLDHIFASPELAAKVKETAMITESIAYAASDHLPLLIVFELP